MIRLAICFLPIIAEGLDVNPFLNGGVAVAVLNMMPQFTFNYSRYCGFVDAIYFRKSTVAKVWQGIGSTNFKHIFFGQFMVWMAFAFYQYGLCAHSVSISSRKSLWFEFRPVAVLYCNIINVFRVGSNKEMGRINAYPIIAIVKNAKRFWDFSIRYNPCNPVGFVLATLQAELSIPVSVRGLFPHPAWTKLPSVLWNRSAFIYLAPKSSLVFFRRYRNCLDSHISNFLSFVVSVFRGLNHHGERDYIFTIPFMNQPIFT